MMSNSNSNCTPNEPWLSHPPTKCLVQGSGSKLSQGKLTLITSQITTLLAARNTSIHPVKQKETNWQTRRGILISIGGPAFVEYIRPTDEELRKRYNPDLQKRAAEQGSRREQEFDDYVTKLKEWSKSDKSSEFTFTGCTWSVVGMATCWNICADCCSLVCGAGRAGSTTCGRRCAAFAG